MSFVDMEVRSAVSFWEGLMISEVVVSVVVVVVVIEVMSVSVLNRRVDKMDDEISPPRVV